MTSNYEVQVVNFQRGGPKYARQLGGTFNSVSKLWTIPQTEKVDRYLAAAGIYGLKVVRAPQASTAEAVHADPYMGQMCPLCHTVCYGNCKI